MGFALFGQGIVRAHLGAHGDIPMTRPIHKYSNPALQAQVDKLYDLVEKSEQVKGGMAETVRFLRRRTDTYTDNTNVSANVAASQGKLLRATKQGFVEIESV